MDKTVDKVKEAELNLDHVNYVISLNLSEATLAKRMWRAKKVAIRDSSKRSKYLDLCLVKAYHALNYSE